MFPTNKPKYESRAVTCPHLNKSLNIPKYQPATKQTRNTKQSFSQQRVLHSQLNSNQNDADEEGSGIK